MSKRQGTGKDSALLLKRVEELRSLISLSPEDRFSLDDETQLTQLCLQLTEALECTHRRLIETNTKLSVVREIAEGMLSNVKPEEALQTVCSYMHRVLGMDSVGLWLMDRQSGLLEGRCTRYEGEGISVFENAFSVEDTDGKLREALWHMQTCLMDSGEFSSRLGVEFADSECVVAVVPLVSSRQWLPCREVKKCIRQECRAYSEKSAYCWEVPSTLCLHEKGFDLARRTEFCVRCDVFPLLGLLAACREDTEEIPPAELAMLESIGYNVSRILESNSLYGALRVGEEFRQSILDSMGECLVAFDLSGRVLAFNRMAEAVTGFSSEEAKGADPDFLVPQDEMEHSPIIQAMRDGREKSSVDTVVKKRSRGTVPVRMTSRLLRDESDRVRGVIATFTDLRPARKIEAKMRQLDRLAALGRFASSVAHEVRNPLSGIATGIQYMSKKFGDTGPEAENVAFLLREIGRLERIIQDLLRITHPQELVLVRASVTDVVERSLKSLGSQLTDKGINLEMRVSGQIPEVEMDPDQIQQVFINLLKNAVEATHGGGSISLEIAPCEDSEQERGPGVTVTVRDSGPGIDGKTQDRIYEPFFTTKPAGTGLGLYVTHEIMRHHGGEISVSSECGRGAAFTVFLPLRVNQRQTCEGETGGTRG